MKLFQMDSALNHVVLIMSMGQADVSVLKDILK